MKRPEKRRTLREFVTRSAGETHELGVRLARSLRVPGVILLRGPLGSGKTTLTRGIADGLGVADLSAVTSPSFTLVNTYEGRCPIYHVDLYRLHGARDMYSIGLDEFLGSDGVTIIEWSEHLPFPVRSDCEIELKDEGDDNRRILVAVADPAATGTRRKRSPRGRSR